MKRLSSITPFLLLLAFWGIPGCASTGEGGERIRPNEISAEEMAATPAGNLYDVVDQLRPRWFQIRAVASLQQQRPEIGVYINRTHQGGVEVLRSMSKDGVHRLVYLDGPTASAQLRSPGGTALAGAIIVELVAGED